MTLEDLAETLGMKSRGNQTHTADVLLQVVLPIVLILAFFAFTSVRSYESKKQELEKHQLILDQEKYKQALDKLDQEEKNIKKTRKEFDHRKKELYERRKKLEQEGKRLEETRGQLNHQEYQQKKQEIATQQEDLRKQQKELEEDQAKLKEQQIAIERTKEDLAGWWKEISETPHGQLVAKNAEIQIDLQKYKLMAALEKVEVRQREELGIYFLSGREIQIKSARLLDDNNNFQTTCKRIYDIFSSKDSQNREADNIYKLVLEEAGIEDLKTVPIEVNLQEYDKIVASQRASEGKITDGNRKFVKKEIESFLDRVAKQVVTEQHRVIDAYLDYLKKLPPRELDSWNPKLKELGEKVVNPPPDGGDTEVYVGALTDCIYEKLETDLKNQGYHFLEETWRR